MIAVAVKEYDDQNITEECETGWRRFCIEVLVRTNAHLGRLSRDHKRYGMALTTPRNRKAAEDLRRQIAAYRWAFEGTGGEFTFDQTCADLGLDPRLVRAKLLSRARLPPDINLLVRWCACYMEEKPNGHDRRRQDSATGGVGSSIVHRVRNLRVRNSARQGRRGAQSHAVCRR